MERFTYELIEDEVNDSNPLDWTTPTEGRGYYVMAHKNYIVPKELDVDFDEFGGWDEVAEEAKKLSEFKEPVVKFVRWYEHSGVAVSLVDSSDIGGWDVGCAGLVVYEKVDEDYALGTFHDYAAYMSGDVWGVRILLDGEEVDEQWTIFGYLEADKHAQDEVAELNKLTDIEIKRRYGRKAGVRASALHK